jgi:hypothetical protein
VLVFSRAGGPPPVCGMSRDRWHIGRIVDDKITWDKR